MFHCGFEAIDQKNNQRILDAMDPVPLNPDGRYLIARGGFPESDLASETRLGCPVSELMSPEAIAALPTTMAEGDDVKVGDTLGILNCGFVEFADVMGSDDDIANAARTSYTGGKSVRANAGLIRYLLRHHHTTPFEMGELKFRIYIPIFVYRQLFRHRTASQLEPEIAECITNDTAFQTFSVQNEMSGRYVEMPDHYFVPEVASIQKQSEDNKQGRSDGAFSAEEQASIRDRLNADIRAIRAGYQVSLEQDVAKELSRANLPLSQYTLLVWKIDLKNLMHFINLRLHPHAQYEVREYAHALLSVVKSTFPITAQAFEDYWIGGTHLTAQESAAIQAAIPEEQRIAAFRDLCERVKNKRERSEFAIKLGLDASVLEDS